MIGDEAAQRGPMAGASTTANSVDGERHSALPGGEGIRQDGLLAGPQSAAAQALQDAEEDQRAEIGRKGRRGTS